MISPLLPRVESSLRLSPSLPFYFSEPFMSSPTPPAHLLSSYILAQIVQAMPMTKATFEQSYFEVKGSGAKEVPQAQGYLIQHADGYCSWVEKSAFDKSARAIPNTETAPVLAASIPGSVAQREAAEKAAAEAKAKAEADAASAKKAAEVPVVLAEDLVEGGEVIAAAGETVLVPAESLDEQAVEVTDENPV